MKAGEKNYLKESNDTKANCNANVTQVRKSRIYTKATNDWEIMCSLSWNLSLGILVDIP